MPGPHLEPSAGVIGKTGLQKAASAAFLLALDRVARRPGKCSVVELLAISSGSWSRHAAVHGRSNSIRAGAADAAADAQAEKPARSSTSEWPSASVKYHLRS